MLLMRAQLLYMLCFRIVVCRMCGALNIPPRGRLLGTSQTGPLSSRIDLIGCPVAWLPHVVSTEISPCPFSDHSALSLVWSLPDSVVLGPGRWKLNVSNLGRRGFLTELLEIFWANWKLRKKLLSFFVTLVGFWEKTF